VHNLEYNTFSEDDANSITLTSRNIACKQAHLVCYSREYLGGRSRRTKRASEKNGAMKSEPAQKPLNFEIRPCEVTSLKCQGIKYLNNTSEAKN